MLRDFVIDALSQKASAVDTLGMEKYERDVLLSMQADILRSPSCIAAVESATTFAEKRAAVESSAVAHMSLFGSFDMAYALAVGKWAAACDSSVTNDAMSLKRRIGTVAEAAALVKEHAMSSNDDVGSFPSHHALLSSNDSKHVGEVIALLAKRHDRLSSIFKKSFGDDSFVASSWNTETDPWLAAVDNIESSSAARGLGYSGPAAALKKALRS